jgi:hypothetical protein
VADEKKEGEPEEQSEGRSKPESECFVPPSPPEPEVLQRYLLKQSPFDGSEEIRCYVEAESPEETVRYLERISSEYALGQDHQVWDVHTSGERYWVITNPINLYSQRHFPSADYTLSFHLGIAVRLAARHASEEGEGESLFASAWRRRSQAVEALESAKEAEEFQAVGMRCRECLLDIVRSLAKESMVPPKREAPKIGDFIHWSELIANAMLRGSGSKEVRCYLKSVAKAAWQLASWLTHTTNAVRLDAEISVEATQSVLVAYAAAFLRLKYGLPFRCPLCNSYKVADRYLPGLRPENPYVAACEACGWIDLEAPLDQSQGPEDG